MEKLFSRGVKMGTNNEIEFHKLYTTFELCECIMDEIQNDMEFLEQSTIDILEG